MDSTSVITSSGIASIIVALAYVAKLVYDWRRSPPAVRTRSSAAVNDAATANAILNATLDALQDENNRMSARIKHLENEADAKEKKIEELEQRIQAIADELRALKSH